MENEKMPGMPSINPPKHEEEEVKGTEVEKNEELEKPKLRTLEQTISNTFEVPEVPKRGIEVVASMKGFYNNRRIREGQKFFVKNFEDLGAWMICEDKALERKRLEFLKQKKAGK